MRNIHVISLSEAQLGRIERSDAVCGCNWRSFEAQDLISSRKTLEMQSGQRKLQVDLEVGGVDDSEARST